MENDRYRVVIGLEVHIQLSTQSKIFSPESARFGSEANAQVDVVSLGYPGTLPVLNREAVRHAVTLGLALGCTIAPRSVFARKQYFYPDLPKGYQISQFDTPLCAGGVVPVDDGAGGTRSIHLTRIHLEEDAGKSLHGSGGGTLLDFNRCGTPLCEMVTEPDLRSPEEAGRFLQTIRRLVRWLGICDGNMEEGSLRCDANVSLRRTETAALGTKVEVKNLNSIRHVERAIQYEMARQAALLDAGEAIEQETRLWDADQAVTRSMRGKEEAHDYRYFPDPDLVPVVVADAERRALEAALPELPRARQQRFTDELGLPAYDAAVLTDSRDVADYFERTLDALGDSGAAKAVSNVVMTDVLRVLGETGGSASDFPIAPARLAGAVHLRVAGQISSTGFSTLFDALLESQEPPDALATRLNLLQVSSSDALRPIVQSVVESHPAEAARFRAGDQKLMGFFVGQVMRRFSGSADPQAVRTLLAELLAE